MKRSAITLITAALLVAGTNYSLASAICVPGELRVTTLRGHVISTPSAKGQEPLSNALVELRKRTYKRNGELVERTVKRTVTDGNGSFDLGTVSSGKYILYARWTVEERRSDFIFPVVVRSAPRRVGASAELVITLGFAFGDGGCHGSLAQYGNQNTMN
jgi:hypothetical protein